MTYRPLLSGTALIGILSLGLPSGQALAACSTNTPTAGATVSCSGADTTGVSANVDNVSLAVNSNASVITTGVNAINLGFNSTITTNASSTVSSNQTAINIVGGTLYANGTITGGSGTAINFGNSNANFNIYSTSNITGNVVAGSTGDQFRLRQGGGTLNVNDFGTKYIGFDQFIKNDSGTWTLTGTGSQAWTITAGTLQGDTSSMSGNLSISSGANATFSQNTDGTTSGIISGAGSLTKTGTGVLTLSGANTYTGGTTVSGGTVAFSSNNNLGATSSTLTLDGGTLRAQLSGNTISSRNIVLGANGGTIQKTVNGTTYDIAGIISGTGALTLTSTGGGFVTLSGTNTYSGGTTLSNIGVQASADNNFGTGSITLNSGTLQSGAAYTNTHNISISSSNTINTNSFATTASGIISGTGALIKSGAGTLTLSGTNTYSGGTTVSAGTLAGTTTSLQGSIANNSNVTFDQTTNGIYSGTMSGTGTLTKSGTGTVTLSGANTYSGGTTISGGTISASANNNLGTGDITMNGGTLSFGATHTNSHNINLAGNGTILTTGANGTLSGDITGTGVLIKNGTGTLTLSGTNIYSGGTTINQGTLSGTTSSLQGNILTGATLNFNQSTNGTYAGVISGSGAVTKTGTGTVTLTGASIYNGNTTITAGALNINASNNLGTNTGSLILNGGMLQYGAGFSSAKNISIGASNGTIDTNGYNSELSGTVSGAGNLTKTGTGTLTLSGTNTHSGNITISAGTLAGTTNSIHGTISNSGTLNFDQSFNGTSSSNISGTGSLVKSGSGTLTLSGTNSYNGGTTISAGTLEGTTTSLQGNIANNSSLALNQTTNGSFAGDISGTGSLTKAGSGNVTLTGLNSYAGGTTISAGILTGDTDSLQGDIINNASVVFNQTSNDDYAGDMSGLGSLTKTGTGVLTLSGLNSYSGGTTISTGTLAGTTDSLQGNILNNATLLFDQSTNGTFAGVISGTGSLIKSGTGNLTLSGTNPYNGSTTINNGRLTMNGTITGTTTIGASAALGGNGNFGAVVNNGRIAPGNSIGTMNVTGPVTFNSGSVYEVEVDASGNSDKIIATGAITINGGTVDVRAASGTYADTTVYNNIIQGSSRTGTFSGVTTDLMFLTPTLTYDATSVDLTLTRNDVDFNAVAQDEVQAGVADAVQSLGSGNDLYTAFSGLNATEAAIALDTLSGEHNAGITTAAAQSASAIQNVISSRMQRISNVSPTGISPAAGEDNETETRKNFWSEIFGYRGHSDANGTAPSQNRESSGVIFGADAELSDDVFAGIFGGYELGDIYTDSQNANSDINSYHLGIYAGKNITSSWRMWASLTGTYHDIQTTRHIEFTGFSETPEGDTSGYTITPAIETAYRFNSGNFNIEPFAGLSLTHSYLGSYSEKGGGSSNLDVDDISQTNLSHTLGLRAGTSLPVTDETVAELSAYAGWNHTYGDLDSAQTMQFSAGTTPFEVKGAGLTRNSAVFGAGVSIPFGLNDTMAYLNYAGEASADTQNHGVTVGIKMPF